MDAAANTTGLVTVGTKEILDEMVDVNRYITNEIEDITVVAPDWQRYFTSHTTFPWIYSTDTPGLLKGMADQLPANVVLMTKAKMESWHRHGSQPYPVTVQVRANGELNAINCRLLVGADGTNSCVAAGDPGLQKNKKVLFAYEKVFCGEPLLGARPDKTVYHLWFGAFSLGYGGWIAPNYLAGKRVFRIGYATFDYQLKQENKLDKMVQILQNNAYIRIDREEPLIKYGGYFPIGGVLKNTAVDGCLLLGDAAGYCGAFSADGIKGALISGLAAAEVIPAYLNGDRTALGRVKLLMETRYYLISYFRRQVRYRFLWDLMRSNRSFTALFELCEREKDNFLNQFCDAKDMRKSLLSVLLKPRHVPALVRLAGELVLDRGR